MLVAVLRTVTVAPGIAAPFSSSTDPETEPVVCADAVRAAQNVRVTSASTSFTVLAMSSS
jgi:hypothetical protein